MLEKVCLGVGPRSPTLLERAALLFDTTGGYSEPGFAGAGRAPGQKREINELSGIPVPPDFC